MNIIPAIDIRGGKCVRLVRGDPKHETVYSDDPAEIARRWAEQGAERVHVVDLDGAMGKGSNMDVIKHIKAIKLPRIGPILERGTCCLPALCRIRINRPAYWFLCLLYPFKQLLQLIPVFLLHPAMASIACCRLSIGVL